MSIQTVLTSTVVAGLVAAFISWWISERRIAIENVTQERAKWRERIREKAVETHDAIIRADEEALSRVRAQFRLLLNPFHDEDRAIVVAASVSEVERETQAEEFSLRVALLLKHDWERAKREARPFLFRGCSPRRVPYEEYFQKASR
ncbi:hypothetical protein H0Z60_20830 [Ectothiorhodospiraceae bacterium WFHF3C12]|nr:hypothetical protein [Ectothiorhodospiraceae bacterium WFHF3C12]